MVGERGPLSLEKGIVCCSWESQSRISCGAVTAGRGEKVIPLGPTNSAPAFEGVTGSNLIFLSLSIMKENQIISPAKNI